MRQELEAIRMQASQELKQAAEQKALENLRIKYLGKKGELTAILKKMGSLSPEERPVIGQLANDVRSFLEDELTQRARELREAELQNRLENERIDVTLPGQKRELGAQTSTQHRA